MGRDNSGASDSVSDELVRVGIAEAYSETQIQITPEEFRALGLLGVVEASRRTDAAIDAIWLVPTAHSGQPLRL